MFFLERTVDGLNDPNGVLEVIGRKLAAVRHTVYTNVYTEDLAKYSRRENVQAAHI